MSKTNNNEPGLSRTQLAKESGVGVETIRYYERRGLIDSPYKPEHAHPLYSTHALNQLIFVKRAQSAGFTLKEIATLLSLGSDHCVVTKTLAQEKLESIKTQIINLQEMAIVLQSLIEECTNNAEQGTCGLFKTLHDKSCSE